MKNRNSHFVRRTMFPLIAGWTPVRKPQLQEDGPKTARPWQKKAFDLLWDKMFMSVYGPPATGKNILICMLAAEALRKDPTLKVIIAAPQKMITKSMKSLDFYLPSTNQLVDWAPEYLNDTKYNVDTNRELTRTFLTKTRIPGGMSDGAIVMTHATLVMAFKTFPELFKNTLVFFERTASCQVRRERGWSSNDQQTRGNGPIYPQHPRG